MANETQHTDTQQGIYLVGGLLGREEGRTWDPEPGRTVRIRPKIGLMVDGEEIAVDCKDEAQMAEAVGSAIKGDVVTLRVEVRPPYNGKGDVRFFLPGAIEAQSRDRWK
jgi:hypothetical protein